MSERVRNILYMLSPKNLAAGQQSDLNPNITEYYMNRHDNDVVIAYAHHLAFKLEKSQAERIKLDYARLRERRYAHLKTWWVHLAYEDKRTWQNLLDARYFDETNRMRDEVVTTLLEFSKTFDHDERDAVNFIPRGQTRMVLSAWQELRSEIWILFVKEFHV
jgi:hypothetical protein